MSPLLKAEVKRQAEIDGISASAAGSALLEWAIRQKLHLQQAATLETALETILNRIIGRRDARLAHLLVRIAFSCEQGRSLDSTILSRMPGMTPASPAGWVEDQTLRWFARYLKGQKTVSTGPRFEWIADDGQVRSAADYPPPTQRVTAASGSGILAVNADAVSSGALIAATPSALGLHLPITAPAAGSQIVGPPKLTLSYSGLGTSSSVPVYAQIVDKSRNIVVGNVATPMRLTLDGLPHTATFTLEEIAASVGSGSSYELQIVPASSLYAPQRVTGLVDVTNASLSLPVAGG